MEQINKIELKGNVGNIKILNVGEKEVARISMATNYVYKGKDGEPVIETTWHNVTAWEGRDMPNLKEIQKGDLIHVLGRVKISRFTGSDGVERNSYEVVANHLEVKKR